MIEFINTLQFMFHVYKAYKHCGNRGTAYTAMVSHGVPQVACFIATGREAWRVSKRAVEEFQ